MEFVEGSVAGERVVKGKVFPLTLVPPGKSNTCHDLVEMVRREKEKLSEALAEHGAILLRGFQVDSIEDFEKVVEAFGWEEFAYEGAADRNKVASRTHTASEAPLHMFIPFHHEMALIKKVAPKLFFYCLVASPEGGETSIVRSDVIVEEMEKKRHPFSIPEGSDRERSKLVRAAMATEREKEREAELESAMYTNCLLLGLDPAVLGFPAGAGGGPSPRAGFFRHSNPKMGEQLLYFLLSTLRGPEQSAKDFEKVWPIFDSGQSRDFRKIVQGIINKLESQGALPRSNSRVSSLATCCGPSLDGRRQWSRRRRM
ncbi:hypothetical protein J5N97_020079 [Dioscorea zingiberensis]|uniref:TauD/TfdA-like domain-containing protein n=1 Tax=Dioscorea zingiberensis TaxID=325984 RepID=A0A9D5HDB4_9LILI|nr:hypothetical protein J5N97_020079 [Dioscorea zingiberensis]